MMSRPPSSAAPAGREEPAGQAATTGGQAGRPLVLIVDDEEPIAEALAYVIEDAGYTAMVAPHGKAGLALALEYRPALIFTDLMMPQMDGREFVRALRAALDASAPPVVLMTAGDVRFAQGAEAGASADRVLTKPFDLAAVEALLRHFLGIH